MNFTKYIFTFAAVVIGLALGADACAARRAPAELNEDAAVPGKYRYGVSIKIVLTYIPTQARRSSPRRATLVAQSVTWFLGWSVPLHLLVRMTPLMQHICILQGLRYGQAIL